MGNNHPNWLSYFSEGFKPPTSKCLARLNYLGVMKECEASLLFLCSLRPRCFFSAHNGPILAGRSWRFPWNPLAMKDIIGYLHRHTRGTRPHHVQMFKFRMNRSRFWGLLQTCLKGPSLSFQRIQVPTVVLWHARGPVAKDIANNWGSNRTWHILWMVAKSCITWSIFFSR